MATYRRSRQREHIAEIRRSKFSIGGQPNPLTEDLHQAVVNLSTELYAKDIHFLMELIQNAEDNKYPFGVEPTLEFVCTSEDITGTGAAATLLIFNNEKGFSEKNMESICSVGRSTKKGERMKGFIGEKGIGFKSVFLVSRWAYIFSSGYRVRFSEDPNQDCGIGYIVPEWIEEKPAVSDVKRIYGSHKNLPMTTIILPLKSDKVEAVRKQLSQVHPELLLFLSKIKRLSVCDNIISSCEVGTVSAISISSETDYLVIEDKGADCRILHLSVQEGSCREECRYYIWRQAFPVLPENMVESRKGSVEWLISLAFPFGARLKRGTPSVGIYAYLPTAMITNFPFIINADFILASSRENILLDSKWNLGILGCVPTAFINAFVACVKPVGTSHICSWPLMFEFLPVEPSSFPELNKVRGLIKSMLQLEYIAPFESFSVTKQDFCKPTEARRLLPTFRRILYMMKEQGLLSNNSVPVGTFVLDSSLDVEQYNKTLDFLGVPSAECNYDWYMSCINGFDFVKKVPEEIYVELLLFLAGNSHVFSVCKDIHLLKRIKHDGKIRCCRFRSKPTVPLAYYAVGVEQHSWLSKWNMEFKDKYNIFFLPNSTQQALVSHEQSQLLCHWLSKWGVTSISINSYFLLLVKFLQKQPNRDHVVLLTSVLSESFLEKVSTESEVSSICKVMPIVDGDGQVHTDWTKALVPGSGSNWKTLMGCNNSGIFYKEEKYIELWEDYGGKNKNLLKFVRTYTEAVDLLELEPPDALLPAASLQLTSEQAFLLLDWIRSLRTNGTKLPEKFIESIQVGKWVKTCSGFNSPFQSFLADMKEKYIFLQAGNFFETSLIDEKFYKNKIRHYEDELKLIGVKFGSENVSWLMDKIGTLDLSKVTREHAIFFLKFVRYLKKRGEVEESLLKTLKGMKLLKTYQGFVRPIGSVFLTSEKDSILQITNLPVVDETYYGSQIDLYAAELRIVGVVMDLKDAYKLIADNFRFPTVLSTMEKGSALLLLKCIRNLGSSSDELAKKIKCQPWIKTNQGFRHPFECHLASSESLSLLSIVEAPVIDKIFYGDVILSFVSELKSIGVAVDLRSSLTNVALNFKSLSSSGSLTSAIVLSILDCIKHMKVKMASHLGEFIGVFSREKWLKTRHGYRSAAESILSNIKWGSICHFVDLPLVDDAFYGIKIYEYKDELKMMDVVTDFKGGSHFVVQGLSVLPEAGSLMAESSLSLLECIGFLLKSSFDQSLLDIFLEKLSKPKWLKTRKDYKCPHECLLFDSHCSTILKPEDAPFIDDGFYNSRISLYREELKAIGVKVNTSEICNIIAGNLALHTKFPVINRIYAFLNAHKWVQESQDTATFEVWVPNRNKTDGQWVNSRNCVLHDRSQLFSSKFFILDKYYEPPLFPLFSSAFGVAGVPSSYHYLSLWNDWELDVHHQVTSAECYSFWSFMLENWSSYTEQMLKEKITKLPASINFGEGIQLVEKAKVFIPDDLDLKRMLEGASEFPLFVWCPQHGPDSIPPRRLYEVYGCLGVEKISKYLHCCSSSFSILEHTLKQVDPKDGLISKGLIKIVLGFLSANQINVPVSQRHEAVKALLDLPVFVTNEPIVVNRILQLPFAGANINIRRVYMVFWDEKNNRILFHDSSRENPKARIEFIASFAKAISKILFGEGNELIISLCRIIQTGFAFKFEESVVDFLLMQENLHLFMEDEKFLSSAFPSKRKYSD